MLARAYTIIEITPTRLELAVVSGSTVQQRRAERYNPPAPGADWSETLRSRHSTLTGWVNELGVQHAPATVLFSSTTAVAALPSCPAALGESAAERAAILALAESAGYPIGDNPTSASILFTDTRAVEKPGQTNPQKLVHTLACVETEANCALLSQWVTSCGLIPARLLPASAAPIAHLVAKTARHPAGKNNAESDTPLHATLWFGEHESFFIVGDASGIILFRSLSVGVENLVEGLLRPITPRGADGSFGDPITIDRAAARSLIERTGIPQPADIVDDRNGLTGGSILPLMNPVLQRFSVEIKQSLRFGLSDKQRAAVRLTIDGPGSTLPNVDTALAQLCAVTVNPPAQAPSITDRASSTTGNIAAVIATPATGVTLLPASMQEAQITVKARRSLWMGVGISAAMVALYGGWIYMDLNATRQQAETLRARADEADKADQSQRAAAATSAAAAAATAYVARAVGPSPDYAALLALIGQTTDKRTTLEAVDLKETETGWSCHVAGLMQAGDDKAFADAIMAYTDSLSKSPLVAGVKLGAASRTKMGETDAHRFDLTFDLVDLPYTAVAGNALTSAEPTSKQGAAK